MILPSKWRRRTKSRNPLRNSLRTPVISGPRVLALLSVLFLIFVLPRLLPKPPLASFAPSSRSVVASQGELLRLTLASDEQFRLWTPLSDIAPPMQQAMLLYEDRHFYWHPGVNPWALLRAAFETGTGERRMGGSTITMQLARRLYTIDSRTPGGKMQQILAALWLEWRYSKDEILEAYLNYAPFGGNIEGVGAASLVYLRKPARALTVPEALSLAVVPQNPRKRIGQKDGATLTASPELREARLRLAQAWVQRFPEDQHLGNESALNVVFRSRASLPFRAPHLVDHILRQTNEREIHTALNLDIQSTLERVLTEYVRTKAELGIHNASAILVDTSSMQVRALVGSTDYRNESIAGQVNGVFGKRSPGSTLKPFIYGLALDQGIIHSASILRDAPSNYGGFSPENFDGRFAGPLSAQEALIRSRNVPAVDLVARLGRPNLYDLLRMGGVSKLASEAHYGLALTLGGGELTPEELARLYAMLANQGELKPLRYLEKEASARLHGEATSPKNTPTLLSPAAAYITLDMLRQTPRPDTFAPARPAVAWKTGTSWGFRDAWTAGIFGRFVLIVWVGNFDGSSNPALIGIEAAAPLFFRMVDALRAERLDPGDIARTTPTDLQQVSVCAASGDLPNAECRVHRDAWLIAGKSPIRTSTLHRTIWVDTRTGQRVCAPGPNLREPLREPPHGHVRAEVHEYWSSDMLALFRKSGLPLKTPPAGDCPEDENEGAPRIISPLRGVTHLQRLGKPSPLELRAESIKAGKLRWLAGSHLLGESEPGKPLTWTPPQSGRYELRVVDANGLSDSREVLVEQVE